MTDTPTFPNWFDGQKYNFENQLTHLAGKPDLRFLQLGAYTGDASVWLCDNILTGEGSFLRDVDTWQGSDEKEHEHIDFKNVHLAYQMKVNGKPVISYKMTTKDFFENNKAHSLGGYDFIYVDADHTADAVYADAIDSWALLKHNGILAFDDYLWGQGLSPELTPKPAIDRFLLTHTSEYKLLVDSYQVWLRKK
jgi:hypothetical protein